MNQAIIDVIDFINSQTFQFPDLGTHEKRANFINTCVSYCKKLEDAGIDIEIIEHVYNIFIAQIELCS